MRTGIWKEQFAAQYRKQLLMADLAGVETRASLALQQLRKDREAEARPRLTAARLRIAQLEKQVRAHYEY